MIPFSRCESQLHLNEKGASIIGSEGKVNEEGAGRKARISSSRLGDNARQESCGVERTQVHVSEENGRAQDQTRRRESESEGW